MISEKRGDTSKKVGVTSGKPIVMRRMGIGLIWARDYLKYQERY